MYWTVPGFFLHLTEEAHRAWRGWAWRSRSSASSSVYGGSSASRSATELPVVVPNSPPFLSSGLSRQVVPTATGGEQPNKIELLLLKVRHRENILQVRIHQARTQWVKMFWSVWREYLKRAAVCTEVYSTELRCTFSVLY